MSRSSDRDRDPAAHREGVTDLDHLVPLWCRIPGELIVKVEARSAELGLTVDQFVSLGIAAVLPDMIAEGLRRQVYRDAAAATWPGARERQTSQPRRPSDVCS